MMSESCGSTLLLALPDDIFSIVTRSLSPRDLCNLSQCCGALYSLVTSEKVWLNQCEIVGTVPCQELIEWRKAVSSYNALCRFLYGVRPLMGIWVHQNPELGNVVCVIPGFVSVVGCRIIPQELGALGIEDGPILWAPVFEIVGDFDGSLVFFLHGREKGSDYLYPGSVKAIDKSFNMVLLEVEPRERKNGDKLLHSKSFFNPSDKEISRNICRSDSGLSRSQRLGDIKATIPFSRLAFNDKRKLLDVVTSQVRLKVPGPANGPLFPPHRGDEETYRNNMLLLRERRSSLIQLYKLGDTRVDWKTSRQFPFDPTQLELSEIRKSLDHTCSINFSLNEDDDQSQCNKRKSVGRYFRNSISRILGKSTSINRSLGTSKKSSSSMDGKYAKLHEFLKSGDTIGLTLHATAVKLSSYRAWPNMHDSRFALYKLPLRMPTAEREYAGLWGGTFGWPPGSPAEDRPGKALFFLCLSYEESQGQRLLIATKILEGTHYVLHPNGSAMFMVNVDEPSFDPFPWGTDADSLSMNIKHAFAGEGIANGYGFRYPGSKPGSLFVFENDHLAFIWKESKAVLTLQRLNLEELLKKGEEVPALPPITNFSYLTKSYSNVFAGFPNTSTCLSSPRQSCLDCGTHI